MKEIWLHFLDSLDDLTNLVIKLFSDTEDKNVSIPEFHDHPYDDEQVQVRDAERFCIPEGQRNLVILESVTM